MNAQLTKNFTLDELCVTTYPVENNPGVVESAKLLYLATYLLQPIRDRWGALRVTSGYRSLEVNRIAGGAIGSQHKVGEAVDFIPLGANIDEVFKWIVTLSGLQFGQCIREHKGSSDWIHISLPRLSGNNQEALTYDGHRYQPYV